MNDVGGFLMHIEPLDGTNYRRWNQKIFMCLEQLELDYVLVNDPFALQVSAPTEQILESALVFGSTSKTDEALVKKYEKDNKTVRFHLLSSMTDILFDLYYVHKSAKVIWELLEKKYGACDARNTKYMVSKLLAFHMVDNKSIMEQVHEYENLSAAIVNEGIEMCEVFLANALLVKLPPSWSGYRDHLQHKKRDLTLQELISDILIEEAIRPENKANRIALPVVEVNIVEYGESSRSHRFKLKSKGVQKRGRPKKWKKFMKPVIQTNY